MSTLSLSQASFTVYVLVITIGHVLAVASLLATVKPKSAVQSSAIYTPNASNAATVATAAGAALAAQPSTVLSAIDPVTAGAVISAS